jgi:hypothetical protein
MHIKRESFMRFYLMFFLFSTLACTANIPSEHAAYTTVLQRFTALAELCRASAKESSNPSSLASFKVVTSWYQQHRGALKNLDYCEKEEVIALGKECTACMHRALSPHIRQYMVEVSPTPELLDSHIAVFEEVIPDMLKETPVERTIQRVALMTLVETTLAFTWRTKDKELREESGGKKVIKTPKEHIASIFSFDNNLAKQKYATAADLISTVSSGIIDEFVPRGICSQEQKVAELATPYLVAAALTWLFGKEKAVMSSFWRAVNRTVMARAGVKSDHKLFPYINALAYMFPAIRAYSLNRKGTWGHVALDTIKDSALVSAIPLLVDKALPKTAALNPEHRRKVISKSVRDLVKEWCEGARY